MAKCTLTNKVLELVAREVGECFTGNEIVALLKDFGFVESQINYPNTKWVTVLEAFNLLRNTEEEPDIEISKLIAVFLNPLNHEPNADKAHKLAEEVKRFLAYNRVEVMFDGDEYFVLPPSEQTDWDDVDDFFRGKRAEEVQIKGPEIKEDLYQLRTYHQAYIDLLEMFCDNIKKPKPEHNEMYVWLSNKIPKLIEQLKLQHNKIDFYRPFVGDLYSAELEWNGDESKIEFRIGPKLSWDAIRPKLNNVHSQIDGLILSMEDESSMTDDEKILESITALVADHRAKKAKPTPNKEQVQKIEILHKREKEEIGKVKLSDCDISFDDETAKLKVGSAPAISFPSHKKEHLILRHMFGCRIDEAIDWELVHETISGHPQDKINKDDIEKLKRSIRDGVLAINNRITETLNTESRLLSMQNNSVIRHY